MALSAARRLLSTTASSSSAAAAAAPPKLSMLFRNPKPRPPPDPGVDAPRRGPRPKPREPWEEEAGLLLRRLHEGRYLPGPDLSSAPHAVSPDAVKAAAERFGHDHQPVAKYLLGPNLLSAPHAVSPDVVKAAAERFGYDHQPVAKWLSGSDLKKVALFGCPTVQRRTVFASKRLRAFFNIHEDKSSHEAVRSHISQLASGPLGFSGENTEDTANVQQSWISIRSHVCLMCRQSRYICIESPKCIGGNLVVDGDLKVEQFDDIIVHSP